MSQSAPISTVTVLGTGVIGTSVALALRRAGVTVQLSESDGLTPAPADVVVIACPASAVAGMLRDAMARDLGAVYTDVAGVKRAIIAEAARLGCDLSRYVPGHPVVAGDLAEPAEADPDLFAGRYWYLCPLPRTSPAALRAVRSVVRACGGLDRERAADVHDRHMAVVSHLPRILAAAVAAQFDHADEDLFPVNGSRFHQLLHVPGAAPELWADTVERNREQVAAALDGVIRDLSAVAGALRTEGQSTVDAVLDLLAAGRRGYDRVIDHVCKMSPLGNGIPAPEEEWFWVR